MASESPSRALWGAPGLHVPLDAFQAVTGAYSRSWLPGGVLSWFVAPAEGLWIMVLGHLCVVCSFLFVDKGERILLLIMPLTWAFEIARKNFRFVA